MAIREEHLYIKCQEMIRELCETKQPKETTFGFFKEICEMFDFDRASLIVENRIDGGYFKVFEYVAESGNSSKGLKNSMDQYINLEGDGLNVSKAKFDSFFGDLTYKYISDSENIKYLIEEIGFETLNTVSDVFFQTVDCIDFFGIIILERNDEGNLLSSKMLDVLKTITMIIADKIETIGYKKHMQEKIMIEDKLIANEEMPIAVVEKESCKVLFHNALYKKIVPDIKLGEVCHELVDKLTIDEGCGIDTANLVQHISSNNRFWIRKNIPLTLPSGVEACLLYAKDTMDYMKQLDCVDILTKSLSMQGFQNFYNENVLNNDYNYALCTMDIDKFKYINDNLGFETGNDILLKISDVLKGVVANAETFCRINEDRFGILLRYDNMDNLKQRFQNMNVAFDDMKQKYFPTKKITMIGGVCIVDRSMELNAMMDKANIARKNAKGHHENKFSFYDERLEMETAREKFIEERMLRGVNNDEFIPYIQGKFNLETREICGAEALVRWKSDEGIIYPDEFIPIFEKNGFINILDFIMYGKIMRFMRKCLDKGLKLYTISLNVSRGHIQDKHFLDKIMELVNLHKIPTELIELEVTESLFVGGKEELKEFVDAIRAKNIRVSIDDFGTAYSSLHILKDIDVDVLKIDKEFLHNIVVESNVENDPKARHKDEIVLKHIIGMAKELGFEVICEGVETEEQIALLRRVGCELGQGYISSKPMPLEEFETEVLEKLNQ